MKRGKMSSQYESALAQAYHVVLLLLSEKFENNGDFPT